MDDPRRSGTGRRSPKIEDRWTMGSKCSSVRLGKTRSTLVVRIPFGYDVVRILFSHWVNVISVEVPVEKWTGGSNPGSNT